MTTQTYHIHHQPTGGSGYVLRIPEPFITESGEILPSLDIAYHTYGTFHPERNNVVWVCHALTGNSDAAQWWNGLIGAGKLFDPAEYFIVCANMLGSCYGSSGPLTINPATGKPYYRTFPQITVRDMARVHILLREHLGIHRIYVGLGGSMGGQQIVEWAIQEPEVFEYVVPLATNARHSPWGIAFNESQRLALEADPTFFCDTPDAGVAGLKAARSIGMLSYRNYETFAETQRDDREVLDDYRASTYQSYQGEKLVQRFNAHAYWILSKAMDSHNVGRGRGGTEAALQRIQAKTLVVGITSDLLFPPVEQQFLARCIPGACYCEIESQYGHDGFLIEFAALSNVLEEFFEDVLFIP